MKHKILGQVYTPQWIVKEILKEIGYTDKKILSLIGEHWIFIYLFLSSVLNC